MEAHWLPLLAELSGHEYFTARISAASLASCGLAALAADAGAGAGAEGVSSRVAAVMGAFGRLCGDVNKIVHQIYFLNLQKDQNHIHKKFIYVSKNSW